MNNKKNKSTDDFLQKIKFIVFDHPWMLQTIKHFFSNRLVANSSLYKFLVMKKAKRILKIEDISKSVIYIETALSCNSRCVFCAHHYQNMNGIMSMDLFKKIIDECHGLGISYICLGIYGEILVDKDLFEKIAYLRNYGMTYSIVTNGSLLTPEKTNHFFELGGLHYINFSMNGYSKQVYEKMMIGLDRDISYKNVINFLKEKEKCGSDVTVTISAVLTKINKKDLKDFYRFWRKQKGIYMILPIELFDRFGKDYEGEIGKLGPMTKKTNWLSPCRSIWGTFMVYYDGRVSPCCGDNDKRNLIIGDVTKQTLKEIITGRVINKLHECHLSGQRKNHPICGKCYLNSVWFGQ